jgi:hypothetical protein
VRKLWPAWQAAALPNSMHAVESILALPTPLVSQAHQQRFLERVVQLVLEQY